VGVGGSGRSSPPPEEQLLINDNRQKTLNNFQLIVFIAYIYFRNKGKCKGFIIINQVHNGSFALKTDIKRNLKNIKKF
jgi:hypothetical protein